MEPNQQPIQVGDIVVVVPFGRTLRQTIKVTAVDYDADVVTGLLVSKKHPGDFRGYAAGYASKVVAR